ncbi:mucin-5AC-like isoform X1 [Tachysurus vachellii]|uniref:mucin-5AC-like isoform X1 n=1 Tax=Tachysurus vachellii TaxID=175792 RepID=UPI00296B4A79|nr:mucin-5AC-like isoform X1 [Tachysurus vachellii]
MFGSVKKIVSAFETRKHPHPLPPSLSSLCSSSQNPSHIKQTPPLSTTPTPVLKTIPCLFTTPEPHPHPSQPIEQLAMSERDDGEGEKQNVVLRRSGEGRRIPRVRLRDSWPIGKFSCIERNFLSFVTVETKEPIGFSKCPPELDRRRLRPTHCKFTTGPNTTSTTGLNTTSTTSTTGPNTTSTTGPNTISTTGLNTTSTTSTTGPNTTSTTGPNTISTTGLNTTSTTSTTGLNTTSTTSTTGLNTTSKARPNSPTGTKASSAVSPAAKVNRGTHSCKLTIGANANSNSELSLGRHHPVLDCGADKSAFEPSEVSVFPKQVILGNAVAGKGRGQGKGRAFQPQLRLRPSDTTFFTLLLLLRSGSSNSMIAIDNKIEQAMDLVKTHLMLAVREEVEVLREQIKELAERNAQLERENYILRALRENQ